MKLNRYVLCCSCTWRHVETTSAINASCIYERIDGAIEKSDPDCFNECPQPLNKTSDCYNGCYSKATMSMTEEELVAPWIEAVGKGPTACPQVDLSRVKAPDYQKPPEQRTRKFIGGVW